MRKILEDMIEFQKSARSFATETDIHAQKHAFVRVESKSKTIGSFEFVQLDIVHALEDIARISENCHIQPGECFPSVLEVEHKGLLASKPKLTESSEVFRAAKS